MFSDNLVLYMFVSLLKHQSCAKGPSPWYTIVDMLDVYGSVLWSGSSLGFMANASAFLPSVELRKPLVIWIDLVLYLPCLSICLSGVFSHRTSCSRARSSRPSVTRAVTPAATSSRNHYIKGPTLACELSWFIMIYRDLSKLVGVIG